MKSSRHVGKTFVKLDYQPRSCTYKVWLNNAYKGEYQFANPNGVFSFIDMLLKHNSDQLELQV